jgi:hypothetical protein
MTAPEGMQGPSVASRERIACRKTPAPAPSVESLRELLALAAGVGERGCALSGALALLLANAVSVALPALCDTPGIQAWARQ